jgi:hypothetical protein
VDVEVGPSTVFIVEIITTTGKVCEAYPTYEEARRRVESLPRDCLAGLPFIFQELVDTSQRLVREDGKPLQWHRIPQIQAEDLPALADDEPLPLDDGLAERFARNFQVEHTAQEDDDEEPPLPLA